MKQIIITMNGCSKCEMLKKLKPNTETVELDQATLLAFARAIGVSSMPIVVSVGEPQELANVIK